MLFNYVLFSNFLALTVLGASSSRYSTHVARRREGRQSQLNNRLEQPSDAVSDQSITSSNWAGAFWVQASGTFTSVTGTLVVPTPAGVNGAGASAWVGIDGETCQGAILQTGIEFFLRASDGQVTYDAWYEWYPDYAHHFSGISMFSGDVIRLTVNASSTTSGSAMVENLTNGQIAHEVFSSTSALCGQNAEWIVEDYQEGASLAPFANFGSVTFSDAVATGAGACNYTPNGATIVNIKQNNLTLTSVWVDEFSVTVDHV